MKKICHHKLSDVRVNVGPYLWKQSLKYSKSANFWATNMLFTKKLVRISPEIDLYSHQWPQDGKMWYMTAVLVKIHFFLIVPSASPLCTDASHKHSRTQVQQDQQGGKQQVWWLLSSLDRSLAKSLHPGDIIGNNCSQVSLLLWLFQIFATLLKCSIMTNVCSFNNLLIFKGIIIDFGPL